MQRGNICHWSQTQANVAPSSGAAGLNSAVPESIGDGDAVRELVTEIHKVILRGGARACKVMLLCKGVGRVAHLSTKRF